MSHFLIGHLLSEMLQWRLTKVPAASQDEPGRGQCWLYLKVLYRICLSSCRSCILPVCMRTAWSPLTHTVLPLFPWAPQWVTNMMHRSCRLTEPKISSISTVPWWSTTSGCPSHPTQLHPSLLCPQAYSTRLRISRTCARPRRWSRCFISLDILSGTCTLWDWYKHCRSPTSTGYGRTIYLSHHSRTVWVFRFRIN